MKIIITIICIGIFTVSTVNPGYCSSQITVFTSIVPQKFFVQQIGKNFIDVKVMVQPGASPETYEPKPMQMMELTKAALYFSIGINFEDKWLDKIAASNPDMKIIRTDQGISKIMMASHHHDDNHDHKNKSESHSSPDPHIWLSPALVKIQGDIILDALTKIDPANSKTYEKNHARFTTQIKELDTQLVQGFKNISRKRFLVFHPSWGYFAKDYGLEQIPVEIEGKDPKPAQLREIIDIAKKDHIRIIFVQPQNSTRSAQIIAKEIKGKIVYADPLAYNWFDNMNEIAQKFQEVLK